MFCFFGLVSKRLGFAFKNMIFKFVFYLEEELIFLYKSPSSKLADE